jgi:3-isopropylmalate/(R)-2-methylmalate dehydratase small subunit
MTPFVHLDGIAVPFPVANVDTDKVLPAQFLKTVSREGLGAALFATQRNDPLFILNRAPWNAAVTLIALENFGCGSSREHAPWALLDFGIRCILAPSFADIFRNNCLKNGLLPAVLPATTINELLALTAKPATAGLSIVLPSQTVETKNGRRFQFDIEAHHKKALLSGLDEIGTTLGEEQAIARFEARQRSGWPWLTDVRVSSTDDQGCDG